MNTDGGPAFPGPWHNDGDGNATAPDGQLCSPGCTVHMLGMTLRDYFAAKAMTDVMADWRAARSESIGDDFRSFEEDANAMAIDCYVMADAMLRASTT
jgi:hypothetical protein